MSALANGEIDYVSVKCVGDDVAVSEYFNDAKRKSSEALVYLRSSDRFRFLAEDDRILFFTTQRSDRVEISYEYKPKGLFVGDPHFERFAGFWKESDHFGAISRFAEVRSRGDSECGGVFFFGIEVPKGRSHEMPVLKLYFRTCFVAPDGEKCFDDPYFLHLIGESGLRNFEILSGYAASALGFGFHVYMVSWNWDKFTGRTCDKIYLVGKGPDDPASLADVLAVWGFCGSRAAAVLKESPYRLTHGLAGLALCLDSEGGKRVNLYYREKN